MSYLVLARKYRPQILTDLVGQEHITDILSHAIKADKIAHAYLFCGPRGVGKTSCARILAMCLNNESGPSPEPDLDSPVAQEIAKGNSLDVLEIDGASNRGIDEIRTLRENVKFAPSSGRYKIYIVDEVHMLTTEAFNALLKTLEEPPAHVKFLFATTDPNKVPATILSRCQRFDFKRIGNKTIVDLLADIAKKEKLTIDEPALYAIAKAAQGSMRDALSTLDQVSALCDRKIDSSDIYSMLGLVETELMFQLVDALGEKDCEQALETLEEIVNKGKDVKQLYNDLLDHFRNLMIVKIGGTAMGKLLEYPLAIKNLFLEQSEKFLLKEIIVAIDTLVHAQESLRITDSVRLPLEVSFARLTYQGEKAPARQQRSSQAAKPTVKKNETSPLSSSKSASTAASSNQDCESTKEKQTQKEPSRDISLQDIRQMWDTLTHATSREKMSVATFLQEGAPKDFSNAVLTISFPVHCEFQKESLEEGDNKRLVENVFSKVLSSTLTIDYVLSDEHEVPREDDDVQTAIDAFGGQVVSRWHNDKG